MENNKRELNTIKLKKGLCNEHARILSPKGMIKSEPALPAFRLAKYKYYI